MSERNHVVFPLSLIEETIGILKANGARFVRAADFLPDGARLRTWMDYRREYVAWRTGRSNPVCFWVWVLKGAWKRRYDRFRGGGRAQNAPPGQPIVLLQHDADRNPRNTMEVMELERRLGVVSSSYFFRERARRSAADTEPYELDLPALQALEKQGFEIGYHLNSHELESYDRERGRERTRSDVSWFRAHFQLRSFVPHGGVPGPRGEENHLSPMDACLDDLVWYYCGRGIVTDVLWTDGSLESPESRRLPDPREVARNVKGHMRVRFLFHPQYYGKEPRQDLAGVGVTETEWWRGCWAGRTKAAGKF